VLALPSLYVCHHLFEISEVILIVGDIETIVRRMMAFVFTEYEQLIIIARGADMTI